MVSGCGKFLLNGLLSVYLMGSLLSGNVLAVEPMKAEEPVFKPQVKRNEVKIADIDTESFEVGYFTGKLSIEDFGVNQVQGMWFAFHLTDDVFLVASTAQSTAGRSSEEIYSGSDIFTSDERKLTYYNIMLGYNILPGEVYWGDGLAFNTDLYLTLGSGITKFGGDEHSTFVYGIGYRFLGVDWLSLHIDMKNHVFQHDHFARETKVNNLEFTIGMAVFF